MREPEPLPGLAKIIVERCAIVGRRPDLVAELAGEAGTRQDRGREADRSLAHIEEPEGARRKVRAHQALQELPRAGAGDREAAEGRCGGAHEYIRRGLARPEPAQVKLLGEARSHDEEAILRKTGDREIPDDPPGGIEHRGEREASRSRDAGCKHAVEPPARALAGDLVLAVVGGLVKPHRAAHGAAFGAHHGEGFRPAVGRGLLGRHPARREPQGILETEVRPHDGTGRLELRVDRGATHRAGGGQLLVRVGEPEAPRVVLGNLDRGVFRRRERPEARDVHREDVLARIALGHPAREHEPDAAALAEAGHHGAGDPEIPQAAYRTYERVAVGSEGERAVHGLADADPSERRKMPEADLEVRCEPLEVLGQQLHGEVLGRLQRRPHVPSGLIGADQDPAALLAHIDLARVVGGVDELPVAALELRNVLGDEVVMLHGEHRQLDADHVSDLARPEARTVDDMLGVDRALVGHDVPATVMTRREREHAREPLGGGSELARRLHIGVRRAGRIAVAAVRAPQRADEMTRINEGIERPRLLERDHPRLHPEVAGARADELQAVELAGRRREHQAAVRVQPAGLARDGLDLAIQIDGVLLQPRDVGLAVEGVHAAGRVPGRAGGELALLEQQQVGPADLRQVVEHARAHYPTTDDHGSRRTLHEDSPDRTATVASSRD